MSGLVKVNKEDITYEVVDANLAAGVPVEPSATATTDASLQGIKVAAATSLVCVGILSKDCVTEANRAALETGNDATPGAYPFTNFSIPSSSAAVYNRGWFKLVYLTGQAVTYGQRIKSAGAGKVTLWVSGTDSAAAIIGWCATKGGIGGGGGTGLTHINL